jgi:hypothetical protein
MGWTAGADLGRDVSVDTWMGSIEVHVSQLDRLAGLDVCQFGFLELPLSLVLAPGLCSLLVTFKPCMVHVGSRDGQPSLRLLMSS